MSRLNKAVLAAQRFEAPEYNNTYKYLSAGLGGTGYAICLSIGVTGRPQRRIRFLLAQQLWEDVPCLA